MAPDPSNCAARPLSADEAVGGSPTSHVEGMKFAFLVHPLSSQSLDLLRLDEGGLLHRHWGQADLLTLVREAHGTIRHLDRTSRSRRLAGVRVIDELTCLSALPGARAEGRLYEIPMHAGEILDDPDRALSFMQEAIEMARQWGAPLVGLGSLTGVIGNHGAFLAEHATIAVTTGNSLTVYATLKNLERICRETGFDLRDEVVAVIGIPGSIAAALTSSLALRCQRLLVVARRSAPGRRGWPRPWARSCSRTSRRHWAGPG